MKEADEYCVKDLAAGYLKEKQSCASRAEKYIDSVWDICSKDFAPLNDQRVEKLRSLTSII